MWCGVYFRNEYYISVVTLELHKQVTLELNKQVTLELNKQVTLEPNKQVTLEPNKRLIFILFISTGRVSQTQLVNILFYYKNLSWCMVTWTSSAYVSLLLWCIYEDEHLISRYVFYSSCYYRTRHSIMYACMRTSTCCITLVFFFFFFFKENRYNTLRGINNINFFFKWPIPVALHTITRIGKVSQTQLVNILFYLQGVA